MLPPTRLAIGAHTIPEPIYSTAHPGYEGEPDEAISIPTPAPSGEEHTDEAKVATSTADNVTKEYAQKGVFFVVILAMVAWFIRRNRMSHKIDEKSMA